MKPKKLEILWFIKENNPKKALGLLRSQGNGCFIIGGPTGSHLTGHGESWESKWKEYLAKGYIDIGTAKKKGLISLSWAHPKINKEDKYIINIILEKIKK